jgi:hypothetical protein
MLHIFMLSAQGEFHDEGEAKWIVIRGQLIGHINTPCGRPTLAGLSAAWGLAARSGYLVVLSYY